MEGSDSIPPIIEETNERIEIVSWERNFYQSRFSWGYLGDDREEGSSRKENWRVTWVHKWDCRNNGEIN